MKQSHHWALVLSLITVAACRGIVAPNIPPGNFDPVLKLMPHAEMWRYEHGQKFDAGVVLLRTQLFDGTSVPNHPAEAGMAFQIDGYAAQVDTSIVNGVMIPWLSDSSNSGNWDTYTLHDASTWGGVDSMTFAYRGFGKESFTSTVAIAPFFGRIVHPDTISASRGCTFSYEHAVPGDTTLVSVSTADTSFSFSAPDRGSIVFTPNQLPYDPAVNQYGYNISLLRIHWTVCTTPKGKRIGVFSYQGTDPKTLYFAKP